MAFHFRNKYHKTEVARYLDPSRRSGGPSTEEVALYLDSFFSAEIYEMMRCDLFAIVVWSMFTADF